MWLTCCALHNWLLDADGLNATWVSGKNASDYLEHLGLHDSEDALRFVPADHATSGGSALAFDLSGMGPGANGDEGPRGEEIPPAPAVTAAGAGGGTAVTDLSLDEFRKKLIGHFSILWSQHKVTWPTRNAAAEPAVGL